MNPNEAVYYFPYDGCRLAVVTTANYAHTHIIANRRACDHCGKRRYGIRPYYTDDPVNDKPVILAVCQTCARKVGKAKAKAGY